MQPIGVCLRPEYDEYSMAKLGEYSREAEARGFDSVWLAESWGCETVALLSHIGALTKRVRLGTAIVNVFSRTPSLLAMVGATMNDLYDGRFVLGLGTSTRALVEGWHGMAYDRPVTRLADTIRLLRQAGSGEEIHYAGKTVSVDGYRLRIKPQHPPPPIYLAALSPASMKLVGELADGWLPYLLPRRGLADSVTEKPKRGQKQNGFVFADLSADEMLAALERAALAFADQKKWATLVQNAFATDFTWTRSAQDYVKLYEAALKKIG